MCMLKKIKQQWTLLHFAASEGHKNIVEYLIGCKANVNAQDQAVSVIAVCCHNVLCDFFCPQSKQASKESDTHFFSG